MHVEFLRHGLFNRAQELQELLRAAPVHLGASGRLPNLLPEVLNDEADRP
jgi:hypothetical protein